MDCRTTREAMLRAAPAELDDPGDSPLARHLADCERCRHDAATLRVALTDLTRRLHVDPRDAAVERALRAALNPMDTARDPVDATPDPVEAARHPLHGALNPVHASPDPPLATSIGRRPRLRRRRLATLGGAGLIAASAATLLLFQSGDPTPDPLRPPPAPIAQPAPDQPAVNAPADRDVAIFRTIDPRITVVWYLPREETR